MPFFSNPTAFRPAELGSFATATQFSLDSFAGVIAQKHKVPPHSSHPALGHLILLVFEAVLEVVCVSLPGYIVARRGMFDADMQKFVANLNVDLFTPCLIFTKLASQLTAEKLADLAVIPVIFVIQTLVSYVCAISVSKVFGFKKRPRNFVIAMGVFGNSNSLPISLVISLSNTLKGLHWDKIPGDNDDEVAARGILYLLIFQQLGQLVRWSWGYHVLLAPPDKYEEEDEYSNSQIERGEGRYRDEYDSDTESDLLLDISEDSRQQESDSRNLKAPVRDMGLDQAIGRSANGSSRGESNFPSGDQTPVTGRQYTSSVGSKGSSSNSRGNSQSNLAQLLSTPRNGKLKQSASPRNENGHITTFPRIPTPSSEDGQDFPKGLKGWAIRLRKLFAKGIRLVLNGIGSASKTMFHSLPIPLQSLLNKAGSAIGRFLKGLWAFMNPPLWAMLAAIIVASIPSLQRVFFTEGTFINNSVTRAVSQSGGVAVPLILVVLGANLARNTLPQGLHRSKETDKEDTRLLIAALISRMVLPTIVMTPILFLIAKKVPISIVDDPIFVVVCFLLTGAPSALQLAQICQINGVYEQVMSKLLFQSYVIWILPSTLVLVMCALEAVEWANA